MSVFSAGSTRTSRTCCRRPRRRDYRWALELEGAADLGRYRTHRLRVSPGDPAASIEILRVLLDPARAGDLVESIAWEFADGTRAGITLRGGVAVPDDGAGAGHTLRLSAETWADLVSGKLEFQAALENGRLEVVGDAERIRRVLACFEIPAFV